MSVTMDALDQFGNGQGGMIEPQIEELEGAPEDFVPGAPYLGGKPEKKSKVPLMVAAAAAVVVVCAGGYVAFSGKEAKVASEPAPPVEPTSTVPPEEQNVATPVEEPVSIPGPSPDLQAIDIAQGPDVNEIMDANVPPIPDATLLEPVLEDPALSPAEPTGPGPVPAEVEIETDLSRSVKNEIFAMNLRVNFVRPQSLLRPLGVAIISQDSAGALVFAQKLQGEEFNGMKILSIAEKDVLLEYKGQEFKVEFGGQTYMVNAGSNSTI
ncbi:hypothetical protein ACFL1X_07810 [Candidatus Hydrogenedentota bacterium]